MMCSADDESLLLAADLVWCVFGVESERCGMWGSVWWSKEVEVLKKLKLAIFGVQAKSDPSTTFFLFHFQKAIWGADPDLIPQPLSRSHSFNHGVKKSLGATCRCWRSSLFFQRESYKSFASKQPCRWLNSAGRPLSYRRLQQYSPAHIAAAPSRLTSSFVKQAPPLTTAADDWMVSFMIHDPLSCAGQNEQSRWDRAATYFSTVEAGAI
jgi:hypothetical protein